MDLTNILAAGVAMVAAGASLTWSLVVVALTPWVTVVGYEAVWPRVLGLRPRPSGNRREDAAGTPSLPSDQARPS